MDPVGSNPNTNQQPATNGGFMSSEAPPPPVQSTPTAPMTPPPAQPPTPGVVNQPVQPPVVEQGTPTVTSSGGGSGKKKIFVILGVVLLLAALGIGAYFLATQFLFPAQEATPSPSPVAEEEVTALCLNIKAYDSEWNRLSLAELSSLQPGDVVRFSVSGDTSSGNFDMARFSVNSQTLGETTQVKEDTQEFYDEYIIPEDVESFSIEAQLHHQQLDQWI